MFPFQQVLLPTDFSENSKAAQDYACQFADRFGARLHVLTIVQDTALVLPETGMFLTVPMPAIHEIVSAAEKSLQTVPDAQWAETHDVVRQVGVGPAADEIVRYADENHIDLIVVGTHGRSGLQHVLMGSVAERVLRHAKCPVLTIRSMGPDDVS